MSSEGRPLDHVVIAVENLDAAARQYQHLGFNLTPRARHEDRMGTSNRLIQFSDKNFIELIEVDRPNTLQPHAPNSSPPHFSFGAHNKEFLEHGEGMSMLVFQTDDARQDIISFEQSGVQTYAPFDFERQATLPDGHEVTVSFSLGFATSMAMPSCSFFVCQNRAVEYFWKQQYQVHSNQSLGIRRVSLCSDNAERDAKFVQSLFGGEFQQAATGCTIRIGDLQFIDIIAPEQLASIDPGFRIDRFRSPFFAGIDIATKLSGTAKVIPSTEASGVFIRMAL